jgi:8-oxo-dGTP pyrophosphatase MutT (NUDIX family)
MSKRHSPLVFPTVDILLWFDGGTGIKVLMGQKPSDMEKGLYRIPGGFVDALKDGCWEDAARRELKEETGYDLSTHELVYVGNDLIPDSRYQEQDGDRIITSIFTHMVPSREQLDTIAAGDDLTSVSWLLPEQAIPQCAPHHLRILNMALKSIYKQRGRM